jgi:hypothetical protein
MCQETVILTGFNYHGGLILTYDDMTSRILIIEHHIGKKARMTKSHAFWFAD